MEPSLSGSPQTPANRPTSQPRSANYEADSLTWGELGDWLQLVRLPNVFTLLSDCAAASIVAVGVLRPLSAALPILLASLMAYWAGMILNDVIDLEEDREHRPERPLASGRISHVVAGHVANAMLLVSPVLILAVMTFHTSHPLWMGIAFLASVLLSLAVRAYDSPLKRTPLGPPLMGLCRALNILMVGFAMLAITFVPQVDRKPAQPLAGVLDVGTRLGESSDDSGLDVGTRLGESSDLRAAPQQFRLTAAALQAPSTTSPSVPRALDDRQEKSLVERLLVDPLAGTSGDDLDPNATHSLPAVIFPRPLLALAAAIGLYIFGVTVYARREERDSSSGMLLWGVILEIGGLIIIGCLPWWAEAKQTWTLDPRQGYPLLVALIGLTVANRGLAGVWHPVPRKVQLAVKHAILTLILIDAAVVLMWAGPWYGCAVVILLLPALSSAIRFRST